jgi:hypothetical protein
MDGERLYQHHPNGKLIITSKQLNTRRTAAYVEHQCTGLAPAQKVAGYLMKCDTTKPNFTSIDCLSVFGLLG